MFKQPGLYLFVCQYLFKIKTNGILLTQWDPILSFSHTFPPKNTHVTGWRPPPNGSALPHREILDPPLGSFWSEKLPITHNKTCTTPGWSVFSCERYQRADSCILQIKRSQIGLNIQIVQSKYDPCVLGYFLYIFYNIPYLKFNGK